MSHADFSTKTQIYLYNVESNSECCEMRHFLSDFKQGDLA